MSTDVKKKRKSNRKPTRNTYLTNIPSKLFSEQKISKSFKDFAESRILPLLSLDGYKIAQKEKIALTCILNLALAQVRDRVVADNRNNSSNALRIYVWDSLVKAGLCRVYIGSESAGFVSRYKALGKLVDLLKLFQEGVYLNTSLAFNTRRKTPVRDALVVLHSGKTDLETGKPLPKKDQKKLLFLTDLPECILRELKKREIGHRKCNAVNTRHSWWVRPPNNIPYIPNFCQRETHSGRVFRYNRITGWSSISVGQLSANERKNILIDGEPATELDYGQFDIRRLYHLRGINPQGDTYKPQLILPKWYSSPGNTTKEKEFVRKFLKTCTNVLLNVDSKRRGRRAIGNLIQKQTDEKRRFLWNIFYNDEDIFCHAPTQLEKRIRQVHIEINHVFYRDNYLMSLGAAMMYDIRQKFAQENKPAFTLHDGVLCKQSDRNFAKEIMTEVYHFWVPTGFDPIINTKF